MRVKQTAKKILNENPACASNTNNNIATENQAHNECENQNDISDNEVEILVECRRDEEGNQFLLDGTPVIEPAAVDTSTDYKENESSTKEINFNDFIKEIQNKLPAMITKTTYTAVTPRRNVTHFGPNLSTYNHVKCTACNAKYNPYTGQTLFKHPLMEVILCSNCIQNQKEEFFVIDSDDNKETLCRWCVEGGSLICCDICPKSYCKTCIKRNLGRTILSEILNQDDSVQWKCFVCNPKPLESLKAVCLQVFEDVRQFIDKQRLHKLSRKSMSKLTDIVNKKRPLSKAFPSECRNISPMVSPPKMATPSPSSPQLVPFAKSGVMVTSMTNYGTEWYMRNVKLHTIFTEIDDIDSRSLLGAINSTKKCIEAFYSDIRNLETEIGKASSSQDIPAIVSMFQSVYRHHIFNRFCQVRQRIEDDRRTRFVPHTTTPTSSSQSNASATTTKIKNGTPNLVINNVVSTATFINKSVGTQSTMTNGGGRDDRLSHVMDSIDLTDEPDRNEEEDAPIHCRDEEMKEDNRSANAVIIRPEPEQVVDLCADDDPGPVLSPEDDLPSLTNDSEATGAVAPVVISGP